MISMDILQANNLIKKFKQFTAINNVSLTLKEGEILGLLGRNGAGKTTMIQMLLGVLTPTSGEVIYFGKKFSKNREEILEKVNFSSTYTNLPWELTIQENLTYISYLYDIENRSKRVNEIVELFDLKDLLSSKISELSAGQITRVNLAKAFINFPKVLLLDEPTASLDPDVAQYIREFLIQQRERFGVSIILTSHNMSEVEEVCDRVLFIDEGKIIANDTPDKLAKTIEISHIELLFENGFEKAISYLEDEKFKYSIDGKYIIVDLNERKIPKFLRSITDKNLIYNEISIDKPTLEDYFLEISKRSKEGESSGI